MVDRATGHQWEVKHATGAVADLSNPHDVDNVYTWTSLADGNDRLMAFLDAHDVAYAKGRSAPELSPE